VDDQELRELMAAMKAGRVSRRNFIRRMVGLGLAAPLATQLLAHAGLAQSPTPVEYKPTRAGGKPVALVADAILDCSARGDIVLDGFLGSGPLLAWIALSPVSTCHRRTIVST